MNDLNKTMLDIARNTGHLEIIDVRDPLQTPPGPNDWDNIAPEDFGPEHDFEVTNHGTIFIFDPISVAATQWCYKHLPADGPRWGKGFVIEHRYIEAIVNGARRDNLMSLEDYENAMEESHNQSLQRETHSGCML